MPDAVIHLKSSHQLSKILGESKTKITVIDFHATWCGPCHAIAPVFEKLANQYPGVNFLKCDVDAVGDVAQEYKVRAMPTFVFLKGSSEVAQIRGADARGLENTLREYAGSPTPGASGGTPAFSGKGHTLGESSSSNSTGPSLPAITGLTNVDPQVKLLLGFVGAYLVLWYLSS